MTSVTLRRLAGALLVAGMGCAASVSDRFLTSPPVTPPVLASAGDDVVLAWRTDRPQAVHWVTSVDGGRHFGDRVTHPLDAAAAGGLRVSPTRVATDGGGSAVKVTLTLGVAPDVSRLVRAAGGRVHTVGPPDAGGPAPQDEAWQVEPLARNGRRAYALQAPSTAGLPTPIVVDAPATAGRVAPAVVLDVHGALAVAWLEVLPDRQPAALVVRRYAAASTGTAAAPSFDVATVAATGVAEGQVPALAPVPTGVVAAWYDGTAMRTRLVPLDLLCAPPRPHPSAAMPAATP